MTRKLDVDPKSYYAELISQFGGNPQSNIELTQYFLDIRKKCESELDQMHQIVEELKPTPDYRVYGGSIHIPEPEMYYSHSSGHIPFLTCALLEMHYNFGKGWFTVDAHNHIVAADTNALIPVVSQFTSVIESIKVNQLPGDHPGFLESQDWSAS